jgi:hypothetical protein
VEEFWNWEKAIENDRQDYRHTGDANGERSLTPGKHVQQFGLIHI